MKSLVKSLIKLFLFLLMFSTAQAGATPVVLIHGANFSAKSWTWVQGDLEALGISSVAPELYLPQENVDLATVSARLCSVLQKEAEPVILVGHSQGGAIITQAAAQCGSFVKALIYVAAVIPKPGEGVFDDLSQSDNDSYSRCADLNATSNTYVLKNYDSCREAFFADADPSRAYEYFRTMVNEPAAIGNSHASYLSATIDGLPKYYIETLQDQIISPETQQKIIAQTKFGGLFQIDSSHTPFFERHLELSSLIQSIAD
jgi:pimeloyl-ACP methyl ester carboxylesterase